MRIDITEYEKKYSFELENVTQLCGQAILKKTYILESIRRYFGTYKYSEEKNKWRDNIKIDDNVVGRKFFNVVSVQNISELMMMIKISKQSLLVDYVKHLTQAFEFQSYLNNIHIELEEIFNLINTDIHKIGDVELDYEALGIWDFVQKAKVIGTDFTELDEKENYELIKIFLNLVEKVNCHNPQKKIVIIENIDHMITSDEYKDMINIMKKIGNEYDIYFILSTSLDGYIVFDEDICLGISVFGKVDFSVPEFEKLLLFLSDNYPYYRNISAEETKKIFSKIIHRIGQEDFLWDVEDSVVCKMVNQSLMLYDKWEIGAKEPVGVKI